MSIRIVNINTGESKFVEPIVAANAKRLERLGYVVSDVEEKPLEETPAPVVTETETLTIGEVSDETIVNIGEEKPLEEMTFTELKAYAEKKYLNDKAEWKKHISGAKLLEYLKTK